MIEEPEILIIEDDARDADMTMRALKKNNISSKMLHLSDGVEALDFLFAKGKYAERKVEDHPKVILLDLKMPRMDGIAVLRRIRADERTKKIPVVILTSSKESPDIKECYELGVNSYVVKPVDFKTFVAAVSELGLYWMLLNQTAD